MEAIKFRQYHPSQNVNGFEVPSSYHYWGYIYPDYPTAFVGPLSSSSTEVILSERFTGMIDRNGKEIYVGDILALGVKAEDPVGVVEVEERHTEAHVFTFDYALPKFNFPAPYWVEVIGNVKQNKELLK